MKAVKYPVLFFILAGVLAGSALAGERVVKEYRAVRTGQGPKIDGRLDDPCWATCCAETTFTQRNPDRERPPTEKTEFRVLYDNANLYIGVRAHDRHPKEIKSPLARRDQAPESDWIQIDLDPYFDHLTGISLDVNPEGTKIDCAWYEDTQQDLSWDGVWEAFTSRDSAGWTAEFKISFSILRFKRGPDLTFGFNVLRIIDRRHEEDMWMPIYNGESGWMSRAGRLTGLKGITRPRKLELLPYVVSKTDSKPQDPLTNPKGTSYTGSLGLDLKYGLASNLTLDGTVNPDFGQVEADPVVLNLTAYETFYPEKRPFFLEGAQAYNTPVTLFYSRRIGKALYQGGTQYSVNYATDAVKQFPGATTILTAGKLSGKIGPVALGLLDGVTNEAYATVDSAGIERRRLVEPRANYLVGRARADLGTSSLGILGTAVSREGLEPAGTGGLDWWWRFDKDIYGFKGQAVGSRAGYSTDRTDGYGTVATLSKDDGRYLLWSLNYQAYSPKLRLSDLGYLKRNDWRYLNLWVEGKKDDKPFGPLRSGYWDLNIERAWNFNQDELTRDLSLTAKLGTLNWWYFGGNAGYAWQTYDDKATRGGPLIVAPAYWWANGWGNSDSRKLLYLSPSVSYWRGTDHSRGGDANVALTLNPATNFKLTFNPDYHWSTNLGQWVTNVDANGDGVYDHFVFGELVSRILDLTTRADITLSPSLSFQLYAQPYLATGHYDRVYELMAPRSYEFAPYDLGFSPDFNQKSLRGNAVLRWEYRPGSTLYLVWSQNRYEDLTNPGTFSPRRDFRALFDTQGENVFMMKVNYWFNL